jgi:hypothetical protein
MGSKPSSKRVNVSKTASTFREISSGTAQLGDLLIIQKPESKASDVGSLITVLNM